MSFLKTGQNLKLCTLWVSWKLVRIWNYPPYEFPENWSEFEIMHLMSFIKTGQNLKLSTLWVSWKLARIWNCAPYEFPENGPEFEIVHVMSFLKTGQNLKLCTLCAFVSAYVYKTHRLTIFKGSGVQLSLWVVMEIEEVCNSPGPILSNFSIC